jgi:hypothetical protein
MYAICVTPWYDIEGWIGVVKWLKLNNVLNMNDMDMNWIVYECDNCVVVMCEI